MSDVAAEVTLLVRRPPSEVFAALVDGEQITRFWLARTSGPLVEGKRVRWEFLVPGAVDEIEVREVHPDRRLVFAWSDGTVEWTLSPHALGTRLHVRARGFPGDDAAAAARAVESTSGFTLVVGDLKALLETGQVAGLVRDKALLIAEHAAQT
jgi:uncharacterized protein YndB with AHSA1/START domain